MDKGSALVRLPYWDKLSESEKKYVSEHAVIRSCRKGEVVHGYGGRPLPRGGIHATAERECESFFGKSEEGDGRIRVRSRQTVRHNTCKLKNGGK